MHSYIPPRATVQQLLLQHAGYQSQNIHVQKVSALWQSGNWQATSDTTTLGAGHIFGGGDFATMSGGVTNTSGSTQLAQYLAPPPRPNVLPPERIMGIVIGCALICLFTFFIALPLVAICFLVFMSNQSKAKRQLEIWNRQMPRWARLFYCSRCDNFYDPHTRQAAHPAQMRLFLNS